MTRGRPAGHAEKTRASFRMADGLEDTRRALIALSADLARFHDMALLGEGNVSARLTDDRFLVKASGTRLAALAPGHLVEVAARPLLEALADGGPHDDEAMEALLLDARTDPAALKPSVESLFHAWLLQLDGVGFVGHAHPVAAGALLCSPRAEAFAHKRLFPDQVVYCGPDSVLVPYVDPGLVLARAVAERVEAFRVRYGFLPKTILLENHGVIAPGKTPEDVRAALYMAEKAARVFLGAAALGGPVFMSPPQVARIDGRLDEHYRQRMLHNAGNGDSQGY